MVTVTSLPSRRHVRRLRYSKRPVLYWLIATQLVLLMGCITVDALGVVPSHLLYPFAVPIVAIGLLNLSVLDRARRLLRE